MDLSTDSRSASASSVSMVSMSAIGSTLLLTWMTSSFSKQRTTWVIASTSRIWARNLLPRPSPLAAPATRPAMSTNSTVVGSTRCGLTISASAFRRGSGTGTTPTFGSIVQNGKLAAAMPALVSALKRVDLPTFGRPTMPHLMPMCIRDLEFGIRDSEKQVPFQIPNPQSLIPARMQPLHRLVEVAGNRQRQHVEGVVDRPCDLDVVTGRSTAEHPRRDAVLVARMADADPQPVEPAVAEQAHGVAQAVLAAVAAVELQPCNAGRQVEFVVRKQRLLRLDLPEPHRRQHRLAAEVHEGRRLQQPDALAADGDLRGLAEQLGVDLETLAGFFRERVDKTEPGVVPGPRVFRAGVAQPDDESKAFHRNGNRTLRPDRAQRRRRLLLFAFGVALGLAGVGGLRRLGSGFLALGRRLFGFDATLAGHDNGHVMVGTELELRDLHALGQHQARQVHGVAELELGQVDLDVQRQVGRQAADRHFGQLVHDHHVRGLARRRDVAVDEVQRHRHADRLVLVHALEVQVHDDLLVRMALHVTQQHLLHLAVDLQVDDRGIEPFLLAGDPGLFLLELHALRIAAATVDDGRDLAGTTQAAARTLPLVLAASRREFLFGHFSLLSLLLVGSPRGDLVTLPRPGEPVEQ